MDLDWNRFSYTLLVHEKGLYGFRWERLAHVLKKKVDLNSSFWISIFSKLDSWSFT